MDSPPYTLVIYRKSQMEHFVEHHIFQREPWHARPVENAADDNGIMRRIEMPEHAARGKPAPAELRAAEEAVEVAGVQALENLFQVEVRAFGARD